MELWISGFEITGNSGKAELLGIYDTDDFETAIELHNKSKSNLKLEKNIYGKWVNWGCTVYDNEKDARKSFG